MIFMYIFTYLYMCVPFLAHKLSLVLFFLCLYGIWIIICHWLQPRKNLIFYTLGDDVHSLACKNSVNAC